MNSYADSNVEGWFASHRLPWSKETAMKLEELGVECIDDLKFLERSDIKTLFKDENQVVKAKAKVAWKDFEDVVAVEAVPPAPEAARDIEFQEEPKLTQSEEEIKVPKVSITAGISIGLSILGVILGIVGCAKAGEAYDCYHDRSYNYAYYSSGYYDDYGNYISSPDRSYTGCDTDTAKKANDVARGTQVSSIVFFALATPLAFYAGRAYLPIKTREESQGNRACANPRCCPFNMALYSWLIYLGTLAWSITFIVIIYANSYSYNYYYGSYYDAGLHVGVLLPNLFAWCMMFGYAEMVRKYKEEISTCC